jgi:hypothetical protein|tara:strand:- start:460 stop:996 length:537 start_codon:yes stop_codon:yes gene_type:complete
MLYASFVRPEGIYSSWFNKAAAFCTGRGDFCHSEFIFRWDNEQREQVLSRVKGFAGLRHVEGAVDVAVYVLWGDQVRYRILNGAGEFWSVPEKDTIKIGLKWEQELNLVTWLSHQIGKQYDTTGALLCPFHWRKEDLAYDRYFCSQLMGVALKRQGYLTYCNPGGLSPNSLFAALKTH